MAHYNLDKVSLRKLLSVYYSRSEINSLNKCLEKLEKLDCDRLYEIKLTVLKFVCPGSWISDDLLQDAYSLSRLVHNQYLNKWKGHIDYIWDSICSDYKVDENNLISAFNYVSVSVCNKLPFYCDLWNRGGKQESVNRYLPMNLVSDNLAMIDFLLPLIGNLPDGNHRQIGYNEFFDVYLLDRSFSGKIGVQTNGLFPTDLPDYDDWKKQTIWKLDEKDSFYQEALKRSGVNVYAPYGNSVQTLFQDRIIQSHFALVMVPRDDTYLKQHILKSNDNTDILRSIAEVILSTVWPLFTTYNLEGNSIYFPLLVALLCRSQVTYPVKSTDLLDQANRTLIKYEYSTVPDSPDALSEYLQNAHHN